MTSKLLFKPHSVTEFDSPILDDTPIQRSQSDITQSMSITPQHQYINIPTNNSLSVLQSLKNSGLVSAHTLYSNTGNTTADKYATDDT